MKLPRDVSGAAAIQALRRLGFEVTRQVGSHVRLAKADKRVSVPLHRALVPRTLQSILRQAGVALEQFMEAMR